MAKDFTLEDPDLDAADAISGVRFSFSVIDVCTKGMQRHAAFTIPFGASDFCATQTASTGNTNALSAQTQSGLHSALHRTTERDTTLQLIRDALKTYSEADLCQSISGYKNSPHHQGQNDRATVYDAIELILRDAKHIDAGLRFYRDPPRTDLSSLTRKNIAAVENWVPPEMRAAG